MYWLLYDICSQRSRLKIVQLCKDYGLRRIQKSCFFGNMDLDKTGEFAKKMSQIVEDEDCVCMIPVNQSMMSRVKIWGELQANIKVEDELVCFI